MADPVRPRLLPSRSSLVTAATLVDVYDRLAEAKQHLDRDAYQRAADLAREAADELDAMILRLERESR